MSQPESRPGNYPYPDRLTNGMSIQPATRRRIAASLMLAFSLPLSGCSDVLGFEKPLEYPDAVRYFDEDAFPRWWAELEACSRVSRRLRSVTFYYVPRDTFLSVLHGIRTVGLYYPDSDRIFVVESEKSNRQVIRHEMMHALLRDESGHPPMYFGADGLCGYL